MAQSADTISLFDSTIIARASRDSFVKLDPRHLIANPVIFVTEVVAALVTVLGFAKPAHRPGLGICARDRPRAVAHRAVRDVLPRRSPRVAGGHGPRACGARAPT